MATTAEEFKEKTIAIVRAHYAANRQPLLLAHLGTTLDKDKAFAANGV